MRVQGYEIKMGKHIAFKSPLQKKLYVYALLEKATPRKKLEILLRVKIPIDQ